jgi:acyl-ACP thioesterase
VSIDPARGRPRALDDAFHAVYGPSAGERRARSRLRHPYPPEGATPARAFTFRAADLDGAAHVNNAVYWAVLEEELAGLGPEAAFDAEVEHRLPGEPGPATVVADGPLRWVLSPAGEVLASFALG